MEQSLRPIIQYPALPTENPPVGMTGFLHAKTIFPNIGGRTVSCQLSLMLRDNLTGAGHYDTVSLLFLLHLYIVWFSRLPSIRKRFREAYWFVYDKLSYTCHTFCHTS